MPTSSFDKDFILNAEATKIFLEGLEKPGVKIKTKHIDFEKETEHGVALLKAIIENKKKEVK